MTSRHDDARDMKTIEQAKTHTNFRTKKADRRTNKDLDDYTCVCTNLEHQPTMSVAGGFCESDSESGV